MHRALKVFVVEDDKALCQSFAGALRKDENITTVEAYDLPEAVRLCRAEPQPVLLVDLGIPGAKGVDAVASLRREQPGATLVVITGAGDLEDDARAAGAHAVIHKGSPDSYGEGLLRAVRKAVVAHDMELLFRPARAGIARQEDLLDRAVKLIDPKVQ